MTRALVVFLANRDRPVPSSSHLRSCQSAKHFFVLHVAEREAALAAEALEAPDPVWPEVMKVCTIHRLHSGKRLLSV